MNEYMIYLCSFIETAAFTTFKCCEWENFAVWTRGTHARQCVDDVCCMSRWAS